MKHFLAILFIILSISSIAQNSKVSFTLDDRDRIIQIEEKLNSQQLQINDIKQEIKDVKLEILNQFYWGFGIMIAFMIFLLGYIIWDRRTAITPVREKAYILSENYQKLIAVLKEYAKKQPELAEILRTNGLLLSHK